MIRISTWILLLFEYLQRFWDHELVESSEENRKNVVHDEICCLLWVQQFRTGIICEITCAVTRTVLLFFCLHMSLGNYICLLNFIMVPIFLNLGCIYSFIYFSISDLMRLCQQMRLRIWNRLQIYLLLHRRAWMCPPVRYSVQQIMLYFLQCYACRMVWS